MFLTELVVKEPKDGEGEWELVEDLVYQGKRDIITIPAGFKTDFASVPRIFWNIFPPVGRHTKAAVVHDFLYREKPTVTDEEGYEVPVSREDADGFFKRIMGELNVRSWRKWTMWKMVSWFGGKAWKANDE